MTILNSSLRRLTIAFLTCIVAVIPAYACKSQQDKSDGTQIVFRPAESYTQIIVNNNVDVEIVINPKYAGYIVYNTSNEDAPQLQYIYNDNTLIINGSSAESSIISRVQVVCDSNLECVINNASARIGMPKINKDLAGTLTLINNNSGDIGIKECILDEICVVNNNSGRIGIKKAKINKLTAVQNASGKIYVGGTADSANLTNNGDGIIVTRRAKINNIAATINGSGNIECQYKRTLEASIFGTGKIIYKSKKLGKNISITGNDNAKQQVIYSDFKNKNKKK